MHSAGADPLDVAWDGILVDDPSHPRDLGRPIQQALALIFGGDGADAIQQEACDILGVNSLRDYFRRDPEGHLGQARKRRLRLH